MLTPHELGMTFLIITRGLWVTGGDIPTLKRKAVRNAEWPKGVTRSYLLYIVHADTEVNSDGQLVHPSEEAAQVAIYLGNI